MKYMQTLRQGDLETRLYTGWYTEFLYLLSTMFCFRILLRKFRNHKRSKTPEPKQTRQKVPPGV